LVFVVENHSLKQMRRGMPYVSRLANRYGYAKRYYGVTHPSLPNYLAIAGGDTFGIADDDPPSSHPISGPSVFGKAVRGGSTATLYAEGMTSRCQRESAGRYAVKHNPWAYFSDEGRLCRRNDVPLRRFAGDVDAGELPAVGMVIADMCNIAHDCTLRRADTWLKKRIRQVFHGPDWASGQLAVVITADEDDYRSGNKVLTVVAHPSLSHKVVTGRLTHYSLSRSYAEVAGVTPLRKADGARSLLRRFGLTTG
jgi:acid phosphatase